MTENPMLDGPVCVPEKKHEYTLTESLTAIVCIVLGYFYLRCVAVNGGHGLIFKSFDGKLNFVMHYPNEPYGAERAKITEIKEISEEPYLCV